MHNEQSDEYAEQKEYEHCILNELDICWMKLGIFGRVQMPIGIKIIGLLEKLVRSAKTWKVSQKFVKWKPGKFLFYLWTGKQ